MARFTISAFVSLLLFQGFTAVMGRTQQFPVVDGIIGGIPKSKPLTTAFKLKSNNTSTPTPGKLRVTENSGVCETTPGVNQASGYADLTSTQSLWFWFFEARKNPQNAPLAIWLNGGPGSSSMIGLLQENGPCRIRNDSSGVDLNPHSWNNVANMLYIDQPVGVGFSHGDLNVGTSQQAAEDLWKFMQIFFSDPRFFKYAKNEFAIWTESYGGHYGPVTAAHFLNQNAAIANKSISGIPINLKVLGIGDGLTDPISQYPSYLTYAMNNSYHPLVGDDVFQVANATMWRPFGCLDRMNQCAESNNDASTCGLAQLICNYLILQPLAGDYDVYDVRAMNPDPYPPDISGFLTDPNVTSKIGAESTWQQSNSDVYANFANTGDWMFSSLPHLEFVVDSGVRTVLYSGDADYIVSYMGIEAMLDTMQTSFTSNWGVQPLVDWTVGGEVAGVFKTTGQLSYVRFFGAGHEVPAYKYGTLEAGQAALALFTQTMENQSIKAT